MKWKGLYVSVQVRVFLEKEVWVDE